MTYGEGRHWLDAMHERAMAAGAERDRYRVALEAIGAYGTREGHEPGDWAEIMRGAEVKADLEILARELQQMAEGRMPNGAILREFKNLLGEGDLVSLPARSGWQDPSTDLENVNAAYALMREDRDRLRAEIDRLRAAVEQYSLWRPGEKGHAAEHHKLLEAFRAES